MCIYFKLFYLNFLFNFKIILNLFLIKPYKNPPIIDEIITENKNCKPFDKERRGSTNIPPCGAGIPIPKNMVRAPPIEDAKTDMLSTFAGSFNAKGIAPSGIKDSPKIKLAAPVCLSCLLNFLGKNSVAKVVTNGGIIPPAIALAKNLAFPVSENTAIENV